VEDIELLRLRITDGLKALQLLQAEYDAVGWDISNPPFEKFRHISFHFAMMAGHVSRVCEAGEHKAHASSAGTSAVDMLASRDEMKLVVADMLFHGAQLANMLNLSLEDCLIERYSINAQRFAPNSKFASLT
jgi:hypothetical protein